MEAERVRSCFIKLIHVIFCFILFLFCFSAHSVIIYGHRGARGLAPENTLPAYSVALLQGVDYVDLDVAMTKDGVLVVQHDLTLNPNLTRNAKGQWIKSKNLIIKNLTLKQLQTYDVGQIKPNTNYAKLFPSQQPSNHARIPTLTQVIHYIKKAAGDRVGFQIEIKTDPTNSKLSVSPCIMVIALEKIIREEGIINRTKVHAFDWNCLLILQKINPKIITAYLTDSNQALIMRNPDPIIAGRWTAGKLLKNYHYSIPRMIKALGGQWWDAEDIEMTRSQLQEAHQLGLKVAIWSWPERTGKAIDIPLVKKLIAMHVDGVITDRPDLIKNRN